MAIKRELQSHLPIRLYLGKKQSVKLQREKLTADYHILFFDGKRTEKTIMVSLPKSLALFYKIESEIKKREA